MKQIQGIKNEKGFVALFAVLMAAIILAIVVGLSSVAYKEAVLTSSAREGQYAFFAADTGAECALYADKQGAFVGVSGGGGISPGDFECGENPIGSISNGAEPSVNFSFDISDPSRNACAWVNVQKNYQDPLSTDPDATFTKIVSRGYNISCADLGLQNDRAVERVIRVTYQN